MIPANKARILVVDDDRVIVKVIEKLLVMEGYDVIKVLSLVLLIYYPRKKG